MTSPYLTRPLRTLAQAEAEAKAERAMKVVRLSESDEWKLRRFERAMEGSEG